MPAHSGHRFNYVRILAEAASGRHEAILLTSERGVTSSEYDLHLGRAKIRTVTSEEFSPQSVRKIARAQGCDLVVAPDGDRFAVALLRAPNRKRDPRINLLVMRTAVQPRRVPGLSAAAGRLKAILLRAVASQPGVRVLRLKSVAEAASADAHSVLDPIAVKASSAVAGRLRSQLQIAIGERILVIVGVIDARKNVDLVMDAFEVAAPGRTVLVIAGRIDHATKLLIDSRLERPGRRSRVVVLDQILDDVELDSLLASAHAVVLVYSNVGPSGILGKALVLGTMVIAAGSESLRNDAMRNPNRILWSDMTVSDIASNIKSALDSQPTKQDGLNQELLALASEARFAARMLSA